MTIEEQRQERLNQLASPADGTMCEGPLRAALRAASIRESGHGCGHGKVWPWNINPIETVGLPAGVVLLEPAHVDRFQKLLQRSAPRHKFKRVHPLPGAPELVVHLCAAGAAALNSAGVDSELNQFARRVDLEYYPGLRLNEPLLQPPPVDQPSAAAAEEPQSADQLGRFRFIELFGGVGGFRCGLERIGGRCVFASEKDVAARATYRLNFGEEPSGDMTDIYTSEIPEFDLLTAGFPCQSFSARGDRRGLDDLRGQLYREICRVLRGCQPPAFLLENVVMLLTLGGGWRVRSQGAEGFVLGEAARVILAALEDCGYECHWKVINARYWLPQNRERVYIVGVRRDIAGGAAPMDWDRVLAGAHGLASVVRQVLGHCLYAWLTRSAFK